MDRDAALLCFAVERREHFRSPAIDMQREPAPEFELAFDLVGLPPQSRVQLDAKPCHPFRGFEARSHQYFAKVRIGSIAGEFEHVVEILVLGIGAEIDGRELLVANLTNLTQILWAAIGEAESAAG